MTHAELPYAVEVAAQAKVNLRLRVLAREASGYHQIETLFLRLSLADRVRVRRTTGATTLDVSGDVDLSALGAVEQNLAWRAAVAFAAATEMRGGFAIELEKRIPLGGGLGGGSADAGAVLRAMNRMADAPLETEALLALAAQLGADVPFLTTEFPYALAWGRGERMLALEPPPPRAVLLGLPGVHVNTGEAYGWLAELVTRQGEHEAGAVALDVPSLSDWDSLRPLAVNAFEFVVAPLYPAVARLLDGTWAQGACLTMLSGSGSTVFAVAAGESPDVAPRSTAEGVVTLETRTASHVEPVLPIE